MKVITCQNKEPSHIVWDSDESSASETDTSARSTAASSGGDSDGGVQILRRTKTRGDRKFHRPCKGDFLDVEPLKVPSMSKSQYPFDVDLCDMEPRKVSYTATPYGLGAKLGGLFTFPAEGLPLAPLPSEHTPYEMGAAAFAETPKCESESAQAVPIEDHGTDNASDTPPSTEADAPSAKSKRTRPSKEKREHGKRLAQCAFEQYGSNEEACMEKLRRDGASPEILAYACKVLGCLRVEEEQKHRAAE